MAAVKHPKIQELEETLAGLNLDQATQDKMIREATKAISGASQNAFVAALTKAAGHDKLATHRDAMLGMRLNISITFDGEGEQGFSVTARLSAPRTGGGSGRASKKVHVVGDVEYSSAAEACRELGIEVGSDSAARKLKSWAKQNDVEYTTHTPEEDSE